MTEQSGIYDVIAHQEGTVFEMAHNLTEAAARQKAKELLEHGVDVVQVFVDDLEMGSLTGPGGEASTNALRDWMARSERVVGRAERRRIRRGRLPSVQQGQGHGQRTYVPNVKKTKRQDPWRETEDVLVRLFGALHRGRRS